MKIIKILGGDYMPMSELKRFRIVESKTIIETYEIELTWKNGNVNREIFFSKRGVDNFLDFVKREKGGILDFHTGLELM